MKDCFTQRLKGLFRRKCRPTPRPAHEPTRRTIRMMDELEKDLLPRYLAEKGYRHPDRTLEDTAARMGTEKGILQRYFSERKHIDFRTWRTRLRIEEARRLLLEEPDTPVSVISARVGFSNRSNFSRQFASYAGMPPDRWRKRKLTDGS